MTRILVFRVSRVSKKDMQSDIDDDEDDMFESLGVSNEDEVDVSDECTIPPVCPIIPNNECYAVNNVVELDGSRLGPNGIAGVSHEVEVNASLTNLVVSTTTFCSDTNSSRPAAIVRIYEWFVTT